MKVIITGSTGMVGKGVLLECLNNPLISEVLIINRQSINIKHSKLTELIHTDFFDLTLIEEQLKGYDACFFCLGVSSFRMSEQDYTKLTYKLTLNFAKTFQSINPKSTFCYVSGEGTDSTEQGKSMWAKVKGKTENDLLNLGFDKAFMFRPAYIQPIGDIQSKTPLYNVFIPLGKALYPMLKKIFPKYTTTTENIGKAMVNCTNKGYHKLHLHSVEINEMAK